VSAGFVAGFRADLLVLVRDLHAYVPHLFLEVGYWGVRGGVSYDSLELEPRVF
jgi:hypothetical protein